MFYVQTIEHETIFKTEDFKRAQSFALSMKSANVDANFNIVETKQVWTTQTFDEAVGTKL